MISGILASSGITFAKALLLEEDEISLDTIKTEANQILQNLVFYFQNQVQFFYIVDYVQKSICNICACVAILVLRAL